MGAKQSALPLPQAPPPSIPLFALTFRKPDTMTLVNADSNVISVVSRICNECWKRGFEFMGRTQSNAFEVIFKGSPFVIGERREFAENIKQLCSRLLTEFYIFGWECILASDLSRYTDYTTWFFERRLIAEHETPPRICCLSLSSVDKLQLFNGPDQLRRSLRQAVAESYGPGIDHDEILKDEYDHKYFEIQLHGSPWHTTSMDLANHARLCILNIFRTFHQCDYRFYISANLKGTADCIFFINDGSTLDKSIKFSMISLNGNDRLRLFHCPLDVIKMTYTSIQELWGRGLKGIGPTTENIRDYRLGGCPWWAQDSEAIESRAFLAKYFERLLQLGWRIVSSLDISRRINDKSIFILQSRSPSNIRHFCISFNENDKVRIIGARPDVVNFIVEIVCKHSSVQKILDYSGSKEMKLRGTPFEPLDTSEANHVRILMCWLLHKLHGMGCRVIASSDVSAKFHHKGANGPNFPFDVHSWFVVKRD